MKVESGTPRIAAIAGFVAVAVVVGLGVRQMTSSSPTVETATGSTLSVSTVAPETSTTGPGSAVTASTEVVTVPQPTTTAPPVNLEKFRQDIGADLVVLVDHSLFESETVAVVGPDGITRFDPYGLSGRSDGTLVYSGYGEGCCTFFGNATTLDGVTVCETTDGYPTLLHARQRSDGFYVMTVQETGPEEYLKEISVLDSATGLSGVPTFEQDCETGERTPVEPFYLSDGDGRSKGWFRNGTHQLFVERDGNRVSISLDGTVLFDRETQWGFVFTVNEPGTILYYREGIWPAPGHDHAVYAVDIASGEQLWSYEPELGGQELVSFGDDLALIGLDCYMCADGGRTMVVLSAASGEVTRSVSLEGLDILYTR